MPSDWKEDALHHKYDPLPEDAPRHRKKAKRRHVRSDHKHEYEWVYVNDHVYEICNGMRLILKTVERCKVCGRTRGRMRCGLSEPPEGARYFEVKDFFTLFRMTELPEDLEVKR